jgi:hypothetical protein
MVVNNRMNPRRRRAIAVAALGALTVLAAAMPAAAADDGKGRIERIELKTDGPSTRVLVMLSKPLPFDVRVLDADAAKKSPRRLVLDFPHATLAPAASKPIDGGNDLLRLVRTGQFNAETARIVLELGADTKHAVDAFESPPHVTIALAGPGTAGVPSTGAADLLKPTAATAAALDVSRPAAAGVPERPPAVVPGAEAGAADTTAGALAAPKAAAPPEAAEAPKAPVRNIPIRARGRRPYSLNYSR